MIPLAEKWKWVVGYEGLYRVSSFGRVRSVDRVVTNRHGWPRSYKGRILKLGKDSNSYLQVGLSKNGRSRYFFVHRLVLTAFVSPRPPGLQCRHMDGDSTNNRLGNLKWGTRQENYKDSIRHGTNACGERSGLTKLTWKKVRKIRRLYSTGNFSQTELGLRFGITQASINYIVHNKRWIE